MIQPISMLPRRKTRKRGAARRRQFISRFLVVLLVLAGTALGLWYWYSNNSDSNAAPPESSSASASLPATDAASVMSNIYEPSEAAMPSEDVPEVTSEVVEPPSPPAPQYPAASLEIIPPILADSYEMVEDPFFDDAFFIGDSITTGLAVFEPFDHRAVLAKMGLTLKDAADEVAAYDSYAPRKIFILLGANDITYYDMTEAVYAERYRILIQTLRQIFPEARICLQSILPVTVSYTGNERLTNDRILSYNQALADLAAEQDVIYIDIAAAWRLPDGSLHPEVSSDGLHIQFQYYGSWLQILKDHAQ